MTRRIITNGHKHTGPIQPMSEHDWRYPHTRVGERFGWLGKYLKGATK